MQVNNNHPDRILHLVGSGSGPVVTAGLPSVATRICILVCLLEEATTNPGEAFEGCLAQALPQHRVLLVSSRSILLAIHKMPSVTQGASANLPRLRLKLLGRITQPKCRELANLLSLALLKTLQKSCALLLPRCHMSGHASAAEMSAAEMLHAAESPDPLRELSCNSAPSCQIT
jgi:hypothetical protein